MDVISNLEGRLRNTHLSKTDAMVPLFEAVVNAIQSLEDTIASGDFEPTITINVNRVPQQHLPGFADKSGRPVQEKIIGFEIIDNGIGFNEKNYDSFRTLDTMLKGGMGCKGIGRLTWLKVFDGVEISSVFINNENRIAKRKFKCDEKKWIHAEEVEFVESGVAAETRILLRGLKDAYLDYMPKTGDTIALRILEHCLWYYLRDTPPPRIILNDGSQTIDFDAVFDLRRKSTTMREAIQIQGQEFTLSHIKITSGQKTAPIVGLCANSRLVKEVPLVGRVPGLFGSLKKGDSEFGYVCYVSSTVLDESVNNERTGFSLANKQEDVSRAEISLDDIITNVAARAAVYLNDELSEVKQDCARRVKEFVNKKAPRYRPLIDRFPDICSNYNPSIKDSDLDAQLHKELAKFENRIIQEGHDILETRDDEPFDGYVQRVEEYLRDVSDMKKSDLANYVAHRKVVLKFLEKCLRKKPDGTYVDEATIHKLIMPMIQTGEGLSLKDANLWIIDERLAFHDYIASDKPINTIPGDRSGSRLEPDIVEFASFDTAVMVSDGARIPTSITIIELKKPMRNDYSDGPKGNPVDQVLEYLEKIRNNRNMVDAYGRPLDGRMEIPAFCYVICDVTSKLRSICKNRGFGATIDGLGYYTYNQAHNAYIEVIPFCKLLTAAEERNKAFFEQLGLPES